MHTLYVYFVKQILIVTLTVSRINNIPTDTPRAIALSLIDETDGVEETVTSIKKELI